LWAGGAAATPLLSAGQPPSYHTHEPAADSESTGSDEPPAEGSAITVPCYKHRLNDFTPFVDQTPLTISPNSPIELVANLLSRLGVSYLCVVDKGVYCGVIFKKAYIGYVKELEEAGYVR
ncbi:hypothetical protein H4S01_004723, partial [Coemansia sp. RSA 2610]